MKVRTKFLFVFFIVFILFLISHFSILVLHHNRIDNLILKTIDEKKTNFNRILDVYTSDLQVLIYYEYGQWDDVVNFVSHPDKEFAEVNFDWMIPQNYFENICIYNLDFNKVYECNAPGYPEYLSQTDINKGIFTSNREVRFFDLINNRLCEVIATTIQGNDGATNPEHFGYIVAYREWDKKFVNDIKNLTDSIIEIDNTLEKKASEQNLSFVLPLNNWENTVIANLLVSVHSEIFEEAKKSSINIIIINALFSLLVVGLFLAVFIRLISKPLNEISASLSLQNPSMLDKLSNEKNEYGEIADLIISFFKQRDVLYKEVQQRKKAEDSLQKLNEELELLVENRTHELHSLIHQAPLAIGIFDYQGKLVEHNSAYSETIVMDNPLNHELLNFSQSLFSDHLEYHSKVQEILSNGGVFYSQPILYKSKKEEKWIVFRLYSTASDLNSQARTINIIDDVTKNKQLEIAEKKRFESKKIALAMFNAQEKERKRVSVELHDSIGQKLSTSLMKLEVINKESPSYANDLEEIKNTILKTGKELRNIIKNLRPADLDDYGLIKSLKLLCEELSQTYNLKIIFNSYNYPESVNKTIEFNIYRIVQEALNNIIKHANAAEASVQIYYRDNFLIINIEDNGRGISFDFNDLSVSHPTGYGLLNMKRRAESLNGNFYIESSEYLGTEIHVKIPLG